jgi:MFS family permease
MFGTSRLTTQTLTNTETIGFYLWVSFLICFLCNVFAGLISTLMSIYLPVVVENLSGATTEAGLSKISSYINALYLTGWAIGGFFWGYLSDKLGRVTTLSLSTGALGFFTFLISFAPSWEIVVGLRLLSGMAVGGIMVITPILLAEIWPVRTRSVVIGISSIGFPVGIISSGMVHNMIIDWRFAFFIGLLPLAIGISSKWLLTESEHWGDLKSKNRSWASDQTDMDRSNLIRGSIIFGSMLIGLWGMFSWIPTWVQSLLVGDGQSERGFAMMLLGFGGLLGGFGSGWVSNIFGVRKALLICFTGCIVMSFILFGTNDSFSKVIYIELALLAIFFGISQGLLSIFIPQLFSRSIRGTYTGICFNVGRILTAGAVFFVGVLVTSLGGYGNTLLAFATIFIIGFITVAFTKDITKISI